MKIYTSYFGFLKNIPHDIIPVSIARFPPKWFHGREIKALAPEKNLLWKAKHKKISEEDYSYRYIEQIARQFEPQTLYEKLRYTSDGNDIVLLCFEKKGEFCHRRLLAKWLQDTLGINVQEL